MTKRSIALVLTLILALGCFSACSAGGGDTLVVGYDTFSEKFSPFFAQTAYDQDIAAVTGVSLLGYDREGSVVLNGIEGETIAYNGTDYTYNGIADCEITQNKDADGKTSSVVYAFKLREDVVFSDGTPLTADDVIFSMYVLSDPAYDGSATFYSMPVVGMEDYRSGMTMLNSLIYEAGEDNTDFTYWTQAQQTAYWTLLKGGAGEAFAQEIIDYCLENYLDSADEGQAGPYTSADIEASDGLKAAFGMAMWGYGEFSADGTFTDKSGKTYDCKITFPTAADYFANMTENYEGDYVALSDTETAGTSLFSFINSLDSQFAVAVKTGSSADSIKGIVKTGDYSLEVTMTEFDATAVYQFTLGVAPLHYYGDKAAYDYDKNSFGFTKGDLSGVKSKTTVPLGAGAYKFISYSDGIVSLQANESFYLGAPKIKSIKLQEITDNADKVAGVVSGTLDISSPSLSADIVSAIEAGNSNGELTGDAITYTSVDNNGYGYIGICAKNVNVGGEAGSDASKNLRKAFTTLLAVYRDTVINSYYGERAAVIQYPISNTSWAAPKSSDEGYEIAYSKDVNGASIYTSDMTQQAKEAAALEAAVDYLKAAGYTFDEAAGKFTAAPEGARMTYTAFIPAEGKGDHPTYGVLTAAKEALATVGITLEIYDPSDANELWNGLNAGTLDMWVAAWGNSLDPDMYQIYYSENYPTNPDGGSAGNNYYIADDELDKLIVDARTSDNTTYRKGVYRECLSIILDWAVEVPVYQRQNCVIFSTQRLKTESIAQDLTPYWVWLNEVEKLETA